MKLRYCTHLHLIIAFTCLITHPLNGRTGDGYTLQYRIKKGDVLNYSVTGKMEILQEMMGSEVETEAESNAKVKLTSEGMDGDGKLTFLLQYETLTVSVFNPMLDSTFKNPNGLIGKRIRKTITPDGDQIDSEELDKVELGMLTQFGGLSTAQEFLPNLPKAKLQIGDNTKLTDIDSVAAMGGMIITKSEFETKLIGTETKLGYNCVKIEMTGVVTLVGDGAMQGMEINIEGDGDVKRILYFAPKEGIMVTSETIADVEMTAAVTGQMSMKIPITQSRTETLTLVK